MSDGAIRFARSSAGPAALIAMIAASIVAAAIASRHVGGQLLFSRVALIGIAAELGILAAWKRRQVWKGLKSFFTAEAHPLNLAIFRLVVFREIFHAVSLPVIVSFARMPAGLKFAPWGMGLILPLLPIHPGAATTAAVLLVIFSITGFIGFFSRASALACALLGFYALGIPNFYGKVDHTHHLLWFVTILAASRCGDALSLDAAIAAWRRAGRGSPDPPRPSRAYGLPLRFAMLLTALIYFFPGFWKVWHSGFDWFLTDNLQRQLHLFWSWSFNGRWLPAFRIDRHVLLCGMGAAATVVFELSFIGLIFSRRFRAAPVVAGLAFHAATNAFMGISFASLRNCYVAFFDWASIFAFVGRALTLRKDVFPGVVPIEESSAGRRPGVAGVTIVGCVLLLGAVLGGIGRHINGWPFACYPTFSLPPADEISSLSVVAISPNGSARQVRSFGLDSHRFYGLSRNILAIDNASVRDGRLVLLWMRALQNAPGLRTTTAVRFYVNRLWINPDRWERNPEASTMLLEWRPSTDANFPEPSPKEILSDVEWQ